MSRSILVVALLLIAAGFLGGTLSARPALAQSAPKATCLALPMTGPTGLDKAAEKAAGLIDDLHTKGATNVVFGGAYVCGW